MEYKILKKVALFNTIILFWALNICYGQNQKDDLKSKTLGFKYGFGNKRVKDKYISNNSYKGNENLYVLTWTNRHEKYLYKLDILYGNSKLNSGLVTAETKDIDLKQGFLYQINSFSLFNKSGRIYLGPLTDFYLHYRKQNIAGNALSRSFSSALLLSATLVQRTEYDFTKKLLFSNELSMNALSLAARMPDFTVEEYQIVKLQTFVTALNLKNSLSIHYRLTNALLLHVGYHFHLLRFSNFLSPNRWEEDGWSDITLISNNVLLGIKLKF